MAERAAKYALEHNVSLGKAMRAVGYSEGTSRTPSRITKLKGWDALMQKYLPDSDLAKRHQEQLNSAKLTKLYFDADETEETIKEVCKELGVKLLYIKTNKAKDGITANVVAPDHFFRDLALDKAYKLKGRYAGEGGGNLGSKTLIINITGETASRYGLLAKGGMPQPDQGDIQEQ